MSPGAKESALSVIQKAALKLGLLVTEGQSVKHVALQAAKGLSGPIDAATVSISTRILG